MNDLARTYFDHYALVNDLTPKGRRGLWPIYDRLYSASSFLPTDQSARILDFGCGAGLLLEWLLVGKKYINAVGIDTDAGQVYFAKQLGLNAELVADSNAWLEQQTQFSAIIMSDVLEHISGSSRIVLLRNIYRALLPNGKLFVRVPNASSTFGTRCRYICPTHERSYTELSLAVDLAAAGFKKIEVSAERTGANPSLRGMGRFALLNIFRAWRRLEAIAELGAIGLHLPLSLNLIAICQREPS